MCSPGTAQSTSSSLRASVSLSVCVSLLLLQGRKQNKHQVRMENRGSTKMTL